MALYFPEEKKKWFGEQPKKRIEEVRVVGHEKRGHPEAGRSFV